MVATYNFGSVYMYKKHCSFSFIIYIYNGCPNMNDLAQLVCCKLECVFLKSRDIIIVIR